MPSLSLACRRAGNVSLVLVVSGEHLNGATQDLTAEIFDSPLHHFATRWAVDVGVEAGHVGNKTDLDRASCLGGCQSCETDSQCGDKCVEFHGVLFIEVRENGENVD